MRPLATSAERTSPRVHCHSKASAGCWPASGVGGLRTGRSGGLGQRDVGIDVTGILRRCSIPRDGVSLHELGVFVGVHAGLQRVAVPNAHATITGNSFLHIAPSCPAARSLITTSAPALRNAAAHTLAFSRKNGS